LANLIKNTLLCRRTYNICAQSLQTTEPTELSKYNISVRCIDKKKLFKIARKNALSLVQQGVLPVGSVKKDNLANVPTKTVDELTGNANLKYFPIQI